MLALRCQLSEAELGDRLSKRSVGGGGGGGSCAVCGLPAKDKCGKCKAATYCGRLHQALDWKKQHKACCGVVTSAPLPLLDVVTAGVGFPQFRVVVESEPDATERDEIAREEMGPLPTPAPDGSDSAALADALHSNRDTGLEKPDEVTVKFTTRTSCEPKQVLR